MGIEAVDISLILTLIAKIGWDERTRRKQGGGQGKNGQADMVAWLSTLEEKVDSSAAAIRSDLKELRDWGAEHHGDLHERINHTATAIARVEGRLDK